MSKFCIYCGSELPDNAAFCSGCGSKIDSNTTKTEHPKRDVHEGCKELIKKLETCKLMFMPVQEKYDVRNRIQVAQTAKGNTALLYIGFLVLGFIVGNALDYTFWSMGIQGLGVTSCWVGIGIVAPTLIIRKKKKDKRNQETLLDKLNSELKSNYRTKQLPLELAFEYSDPRIISILIGILKKGRADTLKEAINCMLDDYFKAETLQLQKMRKDSMDGQALLSLGILMRMNGK